MARKIYGLRRVLGGESLASVVYGEVASSLYFALGVVALNALGFTPWVLLAVGGLFLLVALSYAEGTTAIPETGGAATLVRRAFNDPLGFVAGWALFLDYLIVIALAALFVPHYLAHALGWEALTRKPWDVVVGVFVIVTIAGIRLWRRVGLFRIAVYVAAAAFASHLLLVALGFAFLFSTGALGRGVDLGVAPTWQTITFALPLAMLAYTGLETVANLASEVREPGRMLPRSLFGGIGAAVVVSVLIGVVGISAYPAEGRATDLGTDWLLAPLVGIVQAFEGQVPGTVVDVLRVVLGLTGVFVLAAAVTTSISGAGRLAYALGQHDMLPHPFATLSRRSVVSTASIVGAAAISSFLLILTSALGREVRFLASLYSFGVLITFTAAQAAVVRLRFREPDLERPFRVPVNIRLHGTPVPVAALVGIPLTVALWVAALATHDAARIAGPIWLLVGAGVYIASRRAGGAGLLEHVEAPTPDLVPARGGEYATILVPVKLGPIGEEVLATAIKLAEEHGSKIHALHVIRVPLDRPISAEMLEEGERAVASLVEARTLAAEHGVTIEGNVVRARAIGGAIVRKAGEIGADLVVLGSAPRWRRQSRFFSPTVDYVLRHAPCEVMVVAYPQGVLEEELSQS